MSLNSRALSLLAVVSISLLSGCVSKQALFELEKKNAVLAQNNGDCVRHNKELEATLQNIAVDFDAHKESSAQEKAEMSKTIEAKEDEIALINNALQARAKRLLALEGEYKTQQEAVNKLKRTMAQALVNFDTEDLSVEVRNGKVYVSLSHKLLFPSGSADINKDGTAAIQKVAEVLKNNLDINIEVIGHTDNQPISFKYANNWELSTARSITITKLLIEDYSIAGERITASGQGEFKPVASNDTEEGKSKNRRTEIVLSPKLDELLEMLEGEKAP